MTSNENERFQRLMTFAKNHRPNGGFSNLYVFHESVNGISTGEEVYGMNQMTDYGFDKFFNIQSTSIPFPTNFYVASDADESVSFKSNHAFQFPSPAGAATVSSTCLTNDAYFNYPMWYYAGTYDDEPVYLVSLMCKFMACYYPDQTSGGSPATFTITQFGIGESASALWTRSWLYDLQGDRTTLTRNPNTRLDIDVYFVMTYNPSLIQSGWSQGRYCALTTMHRFIRQHMGWDDTNLYTYKRYNSMTNRGCESRTTDVLTQNHSVIYHTMNGFNLLKQTGASDGYVDGFVQRSPGYICWEHQPLSQENADPFTLLKKPAYGSSPIKPSGWTADTGMYDINKSSLTEIFGLNSEYALDTQFTLFNPTTCNLYNFRNRTYSNPAPFNNDNPDYHYNETSFYIDNATDIFATTTSTGMITQYYLYINPQPSVPITKFTNGNVSIYATDEYWNVNSWHLLTNPMEIPVEEQSRKFYITNMKITLNPTRGGQPFALTSATERTTWTTGIAMRSGQKVYEENEPYGYYVKANYVCFPASQASYQMSGVNSGSASSKSFCFKNMVLTLSSGGADKYYFTNLADPSSRTTTPYSLVDASNGYGSSNDIWSETYPSETTSGVVGFQHLSSTDQWFVATYIEWENDNVDAGLIGHITRRHHFQASMGCCIIDSTKNRIAYCYNGTITVAEYNITNNTWTTTHQLSLPSGSSEPTLMFGYHDHLWVHSPHYMRYYDLTNTTGEGVACTNTFSFTYSNARYIRCDAIDECIIIYRFDDPFIDDINCIRGDIPNTVIPIILGADRTDVTRSAPMYAKLKKIRNDTIAMVCGYTVSWGNYTGSARAIVDLGKFLYKPIDESSGIDIAYNANNVSAGFVSNVHQSGRDGIYCYGDHYIIDECGGFYTKGDPYTVVTHSIPIEYMMTHEYVGSTRTISAINNIRHVTGKQWSTDVTNVIPTYYGDHGKPPGSLN